MTCGCQALPPRLLPGAIVEARVVEIATTSNARKLAIECLAARHAAHALGVPRRAGGRERLAAFGAAAAGGHAQASRHAQDRAPSRRQVDQYPAARRRCSRGGVDHDPAAQWITPWAPLKCQGRIGRRTMHALARRPVCRADGGACATAAPRAQCRRAPRPTPRSDPPSWRAPPSSTPRRDSRRGSVPLPAPSAPAATRDGLARSSVSVSSTRCTCPSSPTSPRPRSTRACSGNLDHETADARNRWNR